MNRKILIYLRIQWNYYQLKNCCRCMLEHCFENGNQVSDWFSHCSLRFQLFNIFPCFHILDWCFYGIDYFPAAIYCLNLNWHFVFSMRCLFSLLKRFDYFHYMCSSKFALDFKLCYFISWYKSFASLLDLSYLSFDLYAIVMFIFVNYHIQFSLLFYKIGIAFDSRLWILWILNLEMTLCFGCSMMTRFKIHWTKSNCRFNCVAWRNELFFFVGKNSMELFHLLVLCQVIIWFPDYCQSLGLKVFT